MHRIFADILPNISKSPVIDDGDLEAANLLILDAAISGLNISRAGIWMLGPDRQTIKCQMLIDHRGQSTTYPKILERKDYPRYFEALDTERVIIANDVQSDESTSGFYSEYSQPLHITSLIEAPIHHRGEMLGILSCEHHGEPREWQPSEIAFACTLADLYGRVISAEQRNNYEKQLQQINENLEAKVAERTAWLESALRNLTHTQAKLIESEKLASVGRMMAGLAHEINTPLGIAVTASSHCDSELKRVQNLYEHNELAENDFKTFLTTINEGMTLLSHNLTRAVDLVQNFKLSGAIQTSSEEEEFELHNCINIIIQSLQPLLKQHTLSCEFASEELITMNSYPGALAQIITNLVTNSLHHGFAEKNSGDMRIHVAAHKDQIHLSYSDNGRGIPLDIQDKIFEPFFTTARKTGGSGLGLAIVYNLVTQKLKGTISVESQANAGASFLIKFPQRVN